MSESDPFAPAMQALHAQLTERELMVTETKTAINALCKASGKPELYPNASEATGAAAVSSLRSDQFYGKKLATATRELLEMRDRAGLGPATVAELFDGLTQGGYNFEASSDENAKRGLRQSLTKNSHTFHRLPGAQIGLLEWYPEEQRKRGRKQHGGDDDAAEADSGSNLDDNGGQQ